MTYQNTARTWLIGEVIKESRKSQRRTLEDIYVMRKQADASTDVAICYHADVSKDASENEREEDLRTRNSRS